MGDHHQVEGFVVWREAKFCGVNAGVFACGVCFDLGCTGRSRKDGLDVCWGKKIWGDCHLSSQVCDGHRVPLRLGIEPRSPT